MDTDKKEHPLSLSICICGFITAGRALTIAAKSQNAAQAKESVEKLIAELKKMKG